MSEPDLKLVTLRSTTIREVAPTLRKIADQIEAGKFGDVATCGLVLSGDAMQVFGMGPLSEAPMVALLLHAGFARLSKYVEERGGG